MNNLKITGLAAILTTACSMPVKWVYDQLVDLLRESFVLELLIKYGIEHEYVLIMLWRENFALGLLTEHWYIPIMLWIFFVSTKEYFRDPGGNENVMGMDYRSAARKLKAIDINVHINFICQPSKPGNTVISQKMLLRNEHQNNNDENIAEDCMVLHVGYVVFYRRWVTWLFES